MVAIESIFRTSKPANLEATWHRREFPSPDGRWTLRLNYAGEPRMGMDVYRLALHDAGRDVSLEHPAITQGPTQAWWQYVPTTQPWSSDSRCLVVATWGARGVGEIGQHEYEFSGSVDSKSKTPASAR